jgi:hypothetical protein
MSGPVAEVGNSRMTAPLARLSHRGPHIYAVNGYPRGLIELTLGPKALYEVELIRTGGGAELWRHDVCQWLVNLDLTQKSSPAASIGHVLQLECFDRLC